MKITVLGTGAYGLALAIRLNKNINNKIIMWTKLEEEKELINNTHMYNKVLPNINIPTNIIVTNNIEEAIKESEIIICAIPISFIENTFEEIKQYYNNQIICIATKGIEQNTNMFVSEILNNKLNTNNIAVLSGASFAIDTVSNYPIGLTIASNNKDINNTIKTIFENTNTNIEQTNDIYGTEICGAIKNVIAIGCGILNGIKVNESTKAMFITKSIKEIKEFITKLKGNEDTILTYSGIGDLILTCTSSKSRNYSYGEILATKTQEEIIEYENNTTIEGRYTLKTIQDISNSNNINLPIINTIYNIVYNKENINELLSIITK